ncbi:MAG: hypothetical protein CM15mP3_00610 [Candidatus Poseidoniales archaeon]|nr:MAG: hypothetical protein CM15mP3_00610 [Candidatus Poseidoniales archaeon]
MEPVFIASGILLVVLVIVSYYVTNGIGTMGAPMRQFALFLMNKAPVGLVDLFKDEPGSGSRTWMKYGTGWFLLAVICGFIGIWHKYDPTALDSLASIGWSYDDGSALADFTNSVMGIAFTYLLVGGCLVAVSRVGEKRLASEANASMVAVLYTASMSFSLILIPIIFRFVDLTDEQSIRDLITLMTTYVVSSLLFIALLMNVLATYSTRGEGTSSVTAWFLIMAIVARLIGSLYHVLGEVTDNTQMVWLSERVLDGWVPLALMFALAYHVIPHSAKAPVWSASLLNANMVLLFVTVPPFFMTEANAGELLQNVGALLLTFSMLPIFAGSINLLITASANSGNVLKNPGSLAATLAMFLLPIFAVGGYFTGMDTLTGTDKMLTMSTTIDDGFMFTVGGLMMLSAIFSSYPLAAGKKLADSSRGSMAAWFMMFGGLAATITMLIGDFTEKAVIDSGIEDAVASTSGFYLTAAALFYLVAIAVVLSTLVLIRTGTSSQKLTEVASAESDVETYTLVEGTTTTIQQLIGRGVGVNTTLVVGDTVDDEGGSTVIAVSASLYNDEVTEFPEEATEDAVEVEDKGPDKQLVMLVDYLKKTNQSVFEFFKSIDLDDSGNIDGFEFQQALKTSDVGDYPPWELDGLLSAIDLDNDGKINLPELDIALAQIAAKYAPSEQDESPEEAPHEEADSEDSDAASHTEASLAKLKKAELIEIAKDLGVSTSGTKSDLTSAILNA